jgi:hypothetical protein
MERESVVFFGNGARSSHGTLKSVKSRMPLNCNSQRIPCNFLQGIFNCLMTQQEDRGWRMAKLHGARGIVCLLPIAL